MPKSKRQTEEFLSRSGMQQEGSQRGQVLHIIPRQKFQNKVSVKTPEKEKNLMATHRTFTKAAMVKQCFLPEKDLEIPDPELISYSSRRNSMKHMFSNWEQADNTFQNICFVYDAQNSD